LSNVLSKGGQKARIINEIFKVRYLLSDKLKLTRYEIDFFLNLLFRRAEPIKNLYRVGKSAGFRIKRESKLVPDINKRIVLGLKFIKAGVNKRQQRDKCSLANAIFIEFMLLFSDKTVRKSFISEFCEIHSKQMYWMTFYYQLEREKIERKLKQSRYSERAF